jgi:uncharacterized RmlC-like cupin family protein
MSKNTSEQPLRCSILHRAEYRDHPRPGITAETGGGDDQQLTMFTLAPGQIDDPVHTHPIDTAAFVLKGKLGFYYGDNLEIYDEAGEGDFLFTPKDVPHLVVNASKTEPAVVLIARPVGVMDGLLTAVPELEKARLEGRTAWKG